MLLNGLNYLWLQLWAMPTGATPLASQLMAALVNSRLLDVAMALQAFAFNALLMLAWLPSCSSTTTSPAAQDSSACWCCCIRCSCC